MKENSCKGCIYHDDFSWACGNGNSEYRGDFVNDGCKDFTSVRDNTSGTFGTSETVRN